MGTQLHNHKGIAQACVLEPTVVQHLGLTVEPTVVQHLGLTFLRVWRNLKNLPQITSSLTIGIEGNEVGSMKDLDRKSLLGCIIIALQTDASKFSMF